jgi:hypothetical protein
VISANGLIFKHQSLLNNMLVCFLCKTSLLDQTKHRECLLKGLEEGLVQSKADWLQKSAPKPKVKKVIRKVLVD